MLEGEVLVSELLSVDGLAAGAVPRGEVAALAVAVAGVVGVVGVVVIVRRWSIAILVAALEFTWHMNCGMTLWKEEPLKPKPFSPVHSARKFSEVLGTTSARSSMMALPEGHQKEPGRQPWQRRQP